MLTHRLKNTPKKESINQVEVQRVSSAGSRYVFTFSSLFRSTIGWLENTTSFRLPLLTELSPGLAGGKITGKPVVLTVHEVWVGKWRSVTGFSGIKCTIHDLLERMLYLFPFYRYVCVSESTQKDLLRRGIAPEKVNVIYNGLDYGFWDPKKVKKYEIGKVQEELGLRDKYVFFCWGRPGNSRDLNTP